MLYVGGGDEALDDLLAVEQSLEQAQKENRQMEKDIERERLLKEDLQKKINLLNVENEQLQRDVESLRDEMENIRYWLLNFDKKLKFNQYFITKVLKKFP